MQSLQAAIEGYSLGLSSSQEAMIGPLPDKERGASTAYTAWASVFPTPAYDINEFYTGTGNDPFSPACSWHIHIEKITSTWEFLAISRSRDIANAYSIVCGI